MNMGAGGESAPICLAPYGYPKGASNVITLRIQALAQDLSLSLGWIAQRGWVIACLSSNKREGGKPHDAYIYP